MVGQRRTCINVEERTAAIHHNQSLNQEGNFFAPRVKVPPPEFRDDYFGFKLDNVQTYYIEQTSDKDIILSLAYDGVVRMVFTPELLQVLEVKFSTC